MTHDKEISKLKDEIEKYRKLCIRSQYLVDEGIEVMTGVSQSLKDILNAVRLHKFSIEDGKNVDECNDKLWELLEDETFSQWG